MLNRCRKYWEVDKTFCDTKKLKRMQIQLCKSSFTNEIFSSKSNPSNTRDITLHLIYGITLYIFRWQKLFQQETIFIEVQVARSLVFCFVFCKSFFVLFFLSILLCPSIYRFWLPIGYLQTLHICIFRESKNKMMYIIHCISCSIKGNNSPLHSR